MKIHRSFVSCVAAAALGASLLTTAGAVQARDVSWSVGIASPGVQLGVSSGAYARHGAVVVQAPVYYNSQPQVYYNQPQVYYSQPQVVYNQPIYNQPAYSQPQVIYSQPQVIYQTQPYYVQSTWAAPVYRPGWGPQHHGRHGDGRRGFNDGRFRDGHR